MKNEIVTKKPRKSHRNSKAARIRKLIEVGKLTSKQIAEKMDVPVQYVYVVRSKIKMQGGGLPAVSTKSPMPVSGGIQGVAQETNYKQRAPLTASRMLRPAHVTLDKPTFIERVKERIRSWLA